MAEPTTNGGSQVAEGDVAMADTEESVPPNIKNEVKLDELFADVDSDDDEFSTSVKQELPGSSSPEKAPSPG